MKLLENQYYHIFNRTNNEEALFRSRDNYLFFLKKYRYYLENYFDTIAYCLMPTHFHYLIRVKDARNPDTSNHISASDQISRAMQTFQSSYTKAYNKLYKRHGSLFQAHFKSKIIKDIDYFISLVFYIHQNPVRSKLVDKPEEWDYSSYQDYIDIRKGSLPDKRMIREKFNIRGIEEITNSICDSPRIMLNLIRSHAEEDV